MANINDFNEDPAQNTSIGGLNIAEGCPPSVINNALRTFMAYVAQAIKGTVTLPKLKVTDLEVLNSMTGAGAAESDAAGTVKMWWGELAAIPSGWVLCDGQNNTPDLRGVFPVGAGGAYAKGATGGAASVTLTTAQLAAHSHGVGTLKTAAHGHSLNDPGHTHPYNAPVPITSGTTGSGGPTDESAQGEPNTTTKVTTGISVNSAQGLSLTGGTAAAGSGQAHENRPPYLALYFIMKT